MQKVEFKPGKLYVTTDNGETLEFDGVAKFETTVDSFAVKKDDIGKETVIPYSYVSKTDRHQPINY